MVNLQAEIQELRAMRAGRSTDDGEKKDDGVVEPSSHPGLMHLSSAAEAARPLPLATSSNGDRDHSEQAQANVNSSDGVYEDTAAADVVLPSGWQCVKHDSGLLCYVNEALRVVTWTKPYTLDSVGITGGFLALARTHVPPLSTFSRRNSMQVASTTRTRRLPPPPSERQDQLDDTHTSKKRKANEALGKPDPVFEVRGRVGNDLPLVEIDGSVLESPEGKTVHAFLREVASVAWRAVPQYYFTKTDDLQNPVACWVRINHRKYANMARSTKPLAKEAAAEAVLEEHLPAYWTDLKKEGRVGKQAQLQQQQQPPQQQDQQQQPQSQQKSAEKKTPVEHEPSMSLDDFKKLTIDDPRVLQACMELSIKTPAQVLQEYQNRNRGISINYNTVPTEKDGAKLFKTIVTAGSTAAEGTASTKKVAKQLAAQSLLALLHHPRFKCYHDVVDLYSSFNKGNHATAGALPQPLVKTEPPNGSYGRQSPSKKARRTLPTNVSGSSAGGSHHARNGMPRNGWDGYHGYGVPPNPGPGAGWQQQPSENGMAYAAKRERIVEYSTTPSAYGGYYGGGDGWGYGQGQQYYQYNPSAYHPPAAAGPFPPSMEGGPAPSYGSRDPRARPFNRSEGPARHRYPPE